MVTVVYILDDASGHDGIAHRTRAEAEAEQQFLATVLGIRCTVVACRCA